MARRRAFGLPAPKSAIGDTHVDAACASLTRLSQRSVEAMTKYPHSIGDTIAMLFTPDTVNKAREAYGIIEPSSSAESYSIPGTGTVLTISYKEQRTPTIKEEMLSLQPSAAPLLQFIKAVQDIHFKFEEVKAVLRWLNRNATPGAIRFYFPPAMQLCPNAPIWRDLQEVPSRYNEPTGVGDWIQSIKDSTTTIATSALLPGDAASREYRGLRLTFGSTTIRLTSRTYFTTDTVNYNI